MSTYVTIFALIASKALSQEINTGLNECIVPSYCETNCVAAIQSCVDACTSDCKIIFEGNEINLFFRNSSDVGILINNKTNIEITGDTLNNLLQKPKLLIHGLNKLFTITDSTNVTISNLFIDLYRNPFTVGVVGLIDYVKKSFTLILNDLTSYPFPGSLRLNDGESYDFLYDVKTVNGYDNTNNKFTEPALRTEGSYVSSIDPETHALTIKCTEEVLNLLNHGQTLVIRHEIEGYDMMSFMDNEDVTVSEVEIGSAAGNGMNFLRNDGITVDNIKISNSKPMTATNKGINMALNKGIINIIDSVFKGIGNDGIHINNYFFEINGTINKTALQLKSLVLDDFIAPWINIGDMYEFRDRQSLKVYFKTKLIDFDADFNIAWFLDELPLQNMNPYDVITSVTAEPAQVNVLSNAFRSSLSAANNIKTKNVNFIGNIYDKITSAAILMNCDAGKALESGISQNVVVSNNNITECNYGTDSVNGTITVTATTRDEATNEDIPLTSGQVHNSIKISQNKFDETLDNGKDKAGLNLRAVRGFYINNNEMIIPKANYCAIKEFNDLLPTVVRSNKCKLKNGFEEPCLVYKGQ